MEKTERMCSKCWTPYRIGAAHTCKPRTAPALRKLATPASAAHVSRPQPKPRPAVTHAWPASPGAVKNGVKNAQPVKNTSTARTRKWRAAHRDASRAYMRLYMRSYRQRLRTATASNTRR